MLLCTDGHICVEVIKDLQENEKLVAEFCDPSKPKVRSRTSSPAETTKSPPTTTMSTTTTKAPPTSGIQTFLPVASGLFGYCFHKDFHAEFMKMIANFLDLFLK